MAAAALALSLAQAAQALPFKQRAHGANPGEEALPPGLEGVEITERLGEKVPLDATFTGSDGKPVRLADVAGKGKPVVVALVYYNCPMLCGLVLSGMARGMRESGLELGKDYQAVAISFDPRESSKLAAERQRGYTQSLGRPEAAAAWPFLTGEEPEIQKVTRALGFRYAYDEKTKQYAHAAAIFVLAPDGKISRYLYGVEFPGRDLRLALVEAGEGRVGTSLDKILLTCFRYDAQSRRYEPYVVGFIRIAALAVLGGLAITLAVFWRREVKKGTVR
ncbi:MAG: SCO family protein [Deltaproteobacteria bacterium]|nr:SCO family protein [Deltaproteobacteria bacterium]